MMCSESRQSHRYVVMHLDKKYHSRSNACIIVICSDMLVEIHIGHVNAADVYFVTAKTACVNACFMCYYLL